MSATSKGLTPSFRAAKQCAAWLQYCPSIGYRKDQLDRLQEIWWEHHDPETGELNSVRNDEPSVATGDAILTNDDKQK